MTKRRTHDSDKKGRLLEDVVSRLQEAGIGQVNCRVKLKSQAKSDPPRTREVDVLVSVPFVLTTIHISFECRNWAKKVGVKEIDEFKGKLEDVGLPVRHGIYVTTSGFTSDALQRAAQVGVQTLLVSGLTADRLAVTINRARQSTVFIVARITMLQPINRGAAVNQTFEQKGSGGAVFDRTLDRSALLVPPLSLILDNVAASWSDGLVPRELGVHGGIIRVPDGFRLVEQSDRLKEGVIWCGLSVHGVLFRNSGTVESIALRDAISGKRRQERFDLRFPNEPESRSGVVFESEAELREGLRGEEVGYHLIQRVAVPRVQYQNFWIPISGEALLRAQELKRQGREPTFEAVEGRNIEVAWLEDPRRPHRGRAKVIETW